MFYQQVLYTIDLLQRTINQNLFFLFRPEQKTPGRTQHVLPGVLNFFKFFHFCDKNSGSANYNLRIGSDRMCR